MTTTTTELFDDLRQRSPSGWFTHWHRAPTFVDAQRIASIEGCAKVHDKIFVTNQEEFYIVDAVGSNWDSFSQTASPNPILRGPFPSPCTGFVFDGPMAQEMGDFEMFYGSTGSDTDPATDGTALAPFATQDGAIDAVRRRHQFTGECVYGVIRIECLDPVAASAVIHKTWDIPDDGTGCKVEMVDYRGAPVAVAVTANTTLPPGDCPTEHDVPVAGLTVTDTVTDGSDTWFEDPGTAPFFVNFPQITAGIARPGPAAGITTVLRPEYGTFVFGDLTFHNRTCKLTMQSGDPADFLYSNGGSNQPGVVIRYIGHEIEVNGSGGFATLMNTELIGAKVSGGGFLFVGKTGIQNSSHTVDAVINVQFQASDSNSVSNFHVWHGCIFRKSASIFNTLTSSQGALFEGDPTQIPCSIREGGDIQIVNISFNQVQSSSIERGLIVATDHSGINIATNAFITSKQSCQNVIWMRRHGSISNNATATIDNRAGTTSNIINLGSHCHAEDVLGNLTVTNAPGGLDIRLGPNGSGGSLAGGPISDFAANDSQGCFAT